ncbi:MAG: tRNA pseudouridine55 synthase [Patescibacteria group bacterium]|nr:tRNA pseudouridine55 synthase [Patescibacteria group bacterium]
MLESILRIYKKLGETPLEALNRLRLEIPEYGDLPMTYAGRLDPMAEGELLVLIGEECKKKDEYLGMDKEYEFEMLFGFKTDSYDLLGVSSSENFKKEELIEGLSKVLENKKGKFVQKYPPFSSKTVGGVPLFQKTKDGDEYDVPEREVEIYEIQFLGFTEINGSDLLEEIKRRINLVKGDFRQEEIIKKWEEVLNDRGEEVFSIAKARMVCSSGTYVRSLVNGLPYPATTFSIKRTKVFKKE